MNSDKFINLCKDKIVDIFNSTVDKSSDVSVSILNDDVYEVWYSEGECENNALLSTTIPDGMYYESNYNNWINLLTIDSYKKYKKNDFIKAIEYSNYQLSRGELEEMFDFIDTNHDLLVDKEEWQKFVQVFIFPFEKCDIDHNYLLDEAQLKQCFENDPSSKQIGIVLKEQASFYKNIIDLLSFNNHKTINLFSYLILI